MLCLQLVFSEAAPALGEMQAEHAMNPANTCRLEGTVQGDSWTRWRAKPSLRGQVRFWLGVPRELAGEGPDQLLCAIEPKNEEELRRYQAEIRAGRTVQLQAVARAILALAHEDHPCVIFVAEYCGFDGQVVGEVHQVHRKHAQGKMAAAGDDSGAELPLAEVAR